MDFPTGNQGHPGRVAFPDEAKTDHQIGPEDIAVAPGDTRRHTPGEKLGIPADIGHQAVELLSRPRQQFLFAMAGPRSASGMAARLHDGKIPVSMMG